MRSQGTLGRGMYYEIPRYHGIMGRDSQGGPSVYLDLELIGYTMRSQGTMTMGRPKVPADIVRQSWATTAVSELKWVWLRISKYWSCQNELARLFAMAMNWPSSWYY